MDYNLTIVNASVDFDLDESIEYVWIEVMIPLNGKEYLFEFNIQEQVSIRGNEFYVEFNNKKSEKLMKKLGLNFAHTFKQELKKKWVDYSENNFR